MRGCWIIIFSLASMLLNAGCDSREEIALALSEKKAEVVVKVRIVDHASSAKFFVMPVGGAMPHQPEIIVGCKLASLESQGRRIVIEGIKRIAADSLAIGWIADAKIEGDKLILELYNDCSYVIRINKDYHELPLIKKYQKLQ